MTPNIVWATEERALNSWVSWGSCVTEHKFKIGRLVESIPKERQIIKRCVPSFC